MFRILENRRFVEKDKCITYVGNQLSFLGFPIAPKYYKFSEEVLENGLIKHREYLWGLKELETTVGYLKKTKDGNVRVGKWKYYKPTGEKMGKDTTLSIYQTDEYDDKGKLKTETMYSHNSRKVISYTGKNRVLSKEERYRGKKLLSRFTKEGDLITFEKYYERDGKNIHLVRSEKKGSFLFEIETATDGNGDILSQTKYQKASRTLFFMEHQEKGKQTQYSILERLKNPEANNSADYYLNGKILATAHSKEMLNKVFLAFLRLEKERNQDRQATIRLLRTASSKGEKRAIVLAARLLNRSL